MTQQPTPQPRRPLRKWLVAAIIALVLALVVRQFIGQPYTNVSASMLPNVPQEQTIWIDKTAYGPRLPVTVLSVPLVRQWYSPAWQLRARRLPALSDVATGDLVVFNHPQQPHLPVDKADVLLRRCVALPGDTVMMKNKNLWRNGKKQLANHALKHCYVLKTNAAANLNYLQPYGIEQLNDSNEYFVYLDPPQAAELALQTYTEALAITFLPKGYYNPEVYPHIESLRWNADFLGPYLVPGKGVTIELNPQNALIYRDVISRHENNRLEIKDTTVLLNGKPTAFYTFRQNYYYVLSDNRDYSADSRFFGVVPETHLIGKATRFLF